MSYVRNVVEHKRQEPEKSREGYPEEREATANQHRNEDTDKGFEANVAPGKKW